MILQDQIYGLVSDQTLTTSSSRELRLTQNYVWERWNICSILMEVFKLKFPYVSDIIQYKRNECK